MSSPRPGVAWGGGRWALVGAASSVRTNSAIAVGRSRRITGLSGFSVENDLNADLLSAVFGRQRWQGRRSEHGAKSGAVHEGKAARLHDAGIGDGSVLEDLEVDDGVGGDRLGRLEPVQADDQGEALDVDGIVEVGLIDLEASDSGGA